MIVHPISNDRGPRQGATLTEVLMAILIMSIGCVSVITLFPLAILRAVNAHQLTNAKILEENVEAILRANPRILAYSSYARTNYLRPFAVDPLGYAYCLPATSNLFGHDRANFSSGGWNPSTAGATRVNNNLTWPGANAEKIFSLPDSWNVAVDDVPADVTTSPGMMTTITFPSHVDLAAASGGSVDTRVVLISSNGQRSVVRQPATDASKIRYLPGTTPTIEIDYVAGVLPNLPTDLDSKDEVGRVRVEMLERRFSWMLTFSARRRTSTSAPIIPSAHCVIFFRRAFEPEDEQVYFYGNGGGIDATQNVLAPANVNQLQIEWTAGNEPVLKEGNFLFDAENGHWYRMSNISTSGTTATIELDTSILAASKAVMFPRGVVHVFPVEL